MSNGLIFDCDLHEFDDRVLKASTDCPILVDSTAVARPIRSALKLSLGFGGQVAAVLLAQPAGDKAC